MNSGKDSAECSMCHQLVHFEPSDIKDGTHENASTSPAETDKNVIENDDQVPSDEWLKQDEESGDLKIDDETLPKPVNVPEKGEGVAPRKEKNASAAISSGSAVPTELASTSHGGEEKFRNMDEAPRKTSSVRGHGVRPSKRRRVKGTKSQRDEFGWESDRRHRRHSDRATILFVGGAVAAMIVLMVFLLTRSQKGEPESETDKLERQQQEQLLAQQASTMKGYLGKDEADIKATPSWHVEFNNSPQRFMRKLRPIMAGFLEAENWQDRLDYCAERETVRPLMEDYYKGNDDGPLAYREIFSGGAVSLGELFITAYVLMEDYSRRSFVMLRDDDGSWSVDWESFVGYSTMSMTEFKNVRPTEPQMFRLTISRPRPGYFNYEFSDEESWDCYLLMGRDLDEILYAYVKKFGDTASDLNKIFAIHDEAAITLMIRFPEDAPSANQVEVVEVLGEGWVPTIMRKSETDER